MVVCHRAVGIAVELCELVHILPHSLIVGVEDMGTVTVDIDVLHLFGVDIARNVAALVDDKALFPGLPGFMGEYSAVQTGTDNEIIVLFHHCFSFFFCSSLNSSAALF